jgi:hypothetical protein
MRHTSDHSCGCTCCCWKRNLHDDLKWVPAWVTLGCVLILILHPNYPSIAHVCHAFVAWLHRITA